MKFFSEPSRSMRTLRSRLKNGLFAKIEQELQENWSRVDDSKHCKEYKIRKKHIRIERYWNESNVKRHLKEQWARLGYRDKRRGYEMQTMRIRGWEFQPHLKLRENGRKGWGGSGELDAKCGRKEQLGRWDKCTTKSDKLRKQLCSWQFESEVKQVTNEVEICITY